MVAEAVRVRKVGRYYCDICVKQYTDEEAGTMLSTRTYEPFPACPVHKRHPLTEIGAASVEEWIEPKRERRPEIRRPNVKLDRQNYGDDN